MLGLTQYTLHSKPHSTHTHGLSCASIRSSVGASASIHVLLTSCWLEVQGKHSISCSRPPPDPSTSTGAWNLGGEGREERRGGEKEGEGKKGEGRKEEERRRGGEEGERGRGGEEGERGRGGRGEGGEGGGGGRRGGEKA